MTTVVRPKAGPIEGRPVRAGGGVYVYRTRKPSSLFGMLFRGVPWYYFAGATVVSVAVCQLVTGMWWFGLLTLLCTGRHFAYVGETVSFKDRNGEHMSGGGRWKRGAAPWSDLDAECVLRIPHPEWKWLLRSTETVLIFFLQPVYNDRKNRINLRRISRPSARRMRLRRDKRRVRMNFPSVRAAHIIAMIAIYVLGSVYGVW